MVIDFLKKSKHLVINLFNQEAYFGENSMATEHENATILIVDDNEMNRDVLARRIKRIGAEVQMAASLGVTARL